MASIVASDRLAAATSLSHLLPASKSNSSDHLAAATSLSHLLPAPKSKLLRPPPLAAATSLSHLLPAPKSKLLRPPRRYHFPLPPPPCADRRAEVLACIPAVLRRIWLDPVGPRRIWSDLAGSGQTSLDLAGSGQTSPSPSSDWSDSRRPRPSAAVRARLQHRFVAAPPPFASLGAAALLPPLSLHGPPSLSLKPPHLLQVTLPHCKPPLFLLLPSTVA